MAGTGNSPQLNMQQVRREILKLFSNCDISLLSESDSALLQHVMSSIINPPTLSRMIPKDDEYRRALNILRKAPPKVDTSSILPETGFSVAEISIVLQGLDAVDAKPEDKALYLRMREILSSMSQGNTRVWRTLSKSLDVKDIAVYGFLKDMLMRAKQADSMRMESAPQKRSQKRFWDGGVSV